MGGWSLAIRRSADPTDRKSTCLNSSHSSISYAVFCLKKKNTSLSHLIYFPLSCRTDHAIRHQRLSKQRKPILFDKFEALGYHSFRACIVLSHRLVLPI